MKEFPVSADGQALSKHYSPTCTQFPTTSDKWDEFTIALLDATLASMTNPTELIEYVTKEVFPTSWLVPQDIAATIHRTLDKYR